MFLNKEFEIIGTTLYNYKSKSLILGDLHLGYEEYLSSKGVFVPKFQFKDIMLQLENIIKDKEVLRVIFNGDIKHEFGTITNTEWRYVIKLFDFFILKKIEVIVIQGNHDPIVKPLIEKRESKVKLVKEFIINKNLITHGDIIPDKSILDNTKRIIIGHEHPAISIKEDERIEKFKCFLKGKWNDKELIVMPSINPLVEGTDILRENLLSPFLKNKNLDKFEVYICDQSTLYFGTVKDIKKLK